MSIKRVHLNIHSKLKTPSTTIEHGMAFCVCRELVIANCRLPLFPILCINLIRPFPQNLVYTIRVEAQRARHYGPFGWWW